MVPFGFSVGDFYPLLQGLMTLVGLLRGRAIREFVNHIHVYESFAYAAQVICDSAAQDNTRLLRILGPELQAVAGLLNDFFAKITSLQPFLGEKRHRDWFSRVIHKIRWKHYDGILSSLRADLAGKFEVINLVINSMRL